MTSFLGSLNLKQDFTRKIIYDILRAIFIAIIAIASPLIVSKLVVVNVTPLQPYRWHLSFLLIGFTGWVSLVLYRRFNRFRPYLPTLDFDFMVIREEITYEYITATKFRYRKRKVLRALKDGLEVYNDRYHWTGKGRASVKSAIADQLFRETIRKNVWHCYEIRFPKTLQKGEELETDVIWDLEDESGRAVPFMSSNIEEPTEHLKMSVILAPSLGITYVIKEKSLGIGVRKALSSEKLNLDSQGKGSWEIPKPLLLYHYELKWHMPEPTGIQQAS